MVLVVLVAAYCISVLVQGADGAASTASRWLGIAAGTAAVAVCLGAVVRTRHSRGVVVLGSAAITAHIIADTYYSLSQDEKQSLTQASVIDAAYVVFYVLMLGVVAVLVRRRGKVAWPMLLNSVVAALAGSSVSALLLAPIFSTERQHITSVQDALTATHAVLALAVAGTVAGSAAARNLDLGPRWPMLLLGLITVSLADYAVVLESGPTSRYFSDIGWVLGPAMIALWVDAAARTGPSARWWDLQLPESLTAVTSTLTALTVLTVSDNSSTFVLARGLAMTTLALAAIPLVFRNRMLTILATTDELTGLPNRRALLMELPPRLQRGRPGALLLMDLDRFKHVNDALGHDVGDALLVQVSRRFSAVLRPEDMLVRLGGDEFAIFLGDVPDAEAARIAELLSAVLRTPIEIGDVSLQVSVSIGIALTPANGTDLCLLMRKADIAMFRAKKDRSGHHVYSPADSDDGILRLRTIQELRTAFAEDQFELYYQPKVQLSDHSVAGVEALVRWNHPVRGQLSPVDFLPLVEESGLLPELSDLVLEHAVRRSAVWRARGLEITVAVNLAGSDITENLLSRLQTLLEDNHVPPESLVLEITENTLMADPQRAVGVLRDLRARGIRTSIDDFGTGYSSLAYLRDLPVDELKLDRSFIETMGSGERARGLVESIITLAHSLGLRVVAEGVENARAGEDLRAMGCDLAQGFHFSAPLPAGQVPSWIETRTITSARDDALAPLDP